ncbi:hypothetical protein [Halomonas sp. G15]|nr:hypothetical protein [Halomonas sp. G15]
MSTDNQTPIIIYQEADQAVDIYGESNVQKLHILKAICQSIRIF